MFGPDTPSAIVVKLPVKVTSPPQAARVVRVRSEWQLLGGLKPQVSRSASRQTGRFWQWCCVMDIKEVSTLDSRQGRFRIM